MSVLQSALDAISVPSPRERGTPRDVQLPPQARTPQRPNLDFQTIDVQPNVNGTNDEDATSKVPVYLSPKSLTFAGLTASMTVIAVFLDNVTKASDLQLATWIGIVAGLFLIAGPAPR